MARVFRATYTKLRTVKDRKGRMVYDEKNGRKVARREPVLGKDGKAVQAKSRKWYVEYRDSSGVVRRKVGYTDRKATEQFAAKLEREAERGCEGMIDPHAEHRKRPLSAHLDDWRLGLLAKGNTDKHAEEQVRRARTVLDGCGFTFWSEISASKVQRFLGDMMRGAKDKPGVGPRTANAYVQAVKQFCKWMVQDNRAPASPLAHLGRYNQQADVRVRRRALTEDECRALIATTARSGLSYGMPGPERALMYRVALRTGLRAGELRSLTPESFDLNDTAPTVTVAGAYSKHRREDVLPLPGTLARDLRAFLRDKEPVERVFRPHSDKTADMVREDLQAAGVDPTDTGSGTLDFHSLRHTFITHGARAGLAPKVLMDLARHSDVNLTMRAYSHTVLADRARALDAFPDLDAAKPGQPTASAAAG